MFDYDRSVIDEIEIPHMSLNDMGNSNGIETNFLQFFLSIAVPDPRRPGYTSQQFRYRRYNSCEKVKDIIKHVSKEFKLPNSQQIYLENNHILYKNGTLKDCLIANDSTVQIISLSQEQIKTRNEGFLFSYWALVPLVFSISFVTAGIIGRFEMMIRACYVLFGTILGIPSLVYTYLGLAATFTSWMRTGFVGNFWFAAESLCFCCNRPSTSDKKDYSEEDQNNTRV